jgi:hypothetical protein
MEWLVGLLLCRAFLKPAAAPTETKLHYILRRHHHILSTQLHDLLHVSSFCANQPSRDLELLFVLNLYIESTCVLWTIAPFADWDATRLLGQSAGTSCCVWDG